MPKAGTWDALVGADSGNRCSSQPDGSSPSHPTTEKERKILVKRLKAILSDRSGEGYIFTCILLICLAGIFALLFEVGTIYMQIHRVSNNVTRILDDYVTVESRDIYGNIKQGTDYLSALDNETFTTSFDEETGLRIENGNEYVQGTEGEPEKFRIKDLAIQFTNDNTLRLNVTYTICFPLRFMGATWTTIEVPQVVVSHYSLTAGEPTA